MPSSVTRADTPALSRGSGWSNCSVTSNRRVTLADSQKLPRLARPDELPDPRLERLARQRIDLDDRRLTGHQVRAIALVDLGAHFHPAGLDHVGDRPSRPDLIAGAVLGQDHAPEDHPARRVPVFLQRDDAVERRLDHQAVDDLLRALHRELRLVPLLPHDRQRRVVGRRARLHVFLQLRQPAPRLLEREHVLLRVERADELVARRVELGAPHVEPRGQQRHVVLRALDRGVRLHLDDLLLRLGELRLRLLERVLLIGRIELDDRFAGLDRRARSARA